MSVGGAGGAAGAGASEGALPPLALTAACGASVGTRGDGEGPPQCTAAALRWVAGERVAHCHRRTPGWAQHRAIAHLPAHGAAQGPSGGGRAPSGRSPASARPPSAWRSRHSKCVSLLAASLSGRCLKCVRRSFNNACAQSAAGCKVTGVITCATRIDYLSAARQICNPSSARSGSGPAHPVACSAAALHHTSQQQYSTLVAAYKAPTKAWGEERYGRRQPRAPQPHSAIGRG